MTIPFNKVITRFAPSPTGDLHIGGARTALFNWLFAKHYGGQFLLRIEDTDRQRSQAHYTQTILEGLTWLGVCWDGAPIIQSELQNRHIQVAHMLLEQGKAYRCYGVEEVEQESIHGPAQKTLNPWRDAESIPDSRPFAIRLKTPLEGITCLNDKVQGEISVANATLDDMVLLRSDGTPTYMLAVVVDDHDMGVTHIIRGADHLTNAFRQIQIYNALGWDIPQMFHIPLIHDAQGHKLSKRHGAVNLLHYKQEGFLPEAMVSALLRLGWSHGDEEKITCLQAIEWFDGKALSASPARFDEDKVRALNRHYLRTKSAKDLAALLSVDLKPCLEPLVLALAQRCETLNELQEAFYTYTSALSSYERALTLEEKDVLKKFSADLEHFSFEDTLDEALEASLRLWVKDQNVSFGLLAKGLRLALTGKSVSPGLTLILKALGTQEVDSRIRGILDKEKNEEQAS